MKEGFEGVQHDASETSITFTCSTSCLGPFSGELACNITLPDYNRSSMKNFSRENVNVTIPDLSSETDYEYNASIFLNGIIVRSIVQNARTLAIGGSVIVYYVFCMVHVCSQCCNCGLQFASAISRYTDVVGIGFLKQLMKCWGLLASEDVKDCKTWTNLFKPIAWPFF